VCRLIGYVSAAPVTVAGLVDPDELAVFTSLSTEHKDGWGVGWRRADGGVAVLKGTGQAWQESAYHRHLAQVASDQQIAPAQGPGRHGGQPMNFTLSSKATSFCHNGQFDISLALPQSVV
jgi:predicted glutamine amidotransferase